MVKGGFQGLDISGVDLTAQSPTLPGAYATCAGADGKPIRVQTADGQVECSVKKVSTNYVLAGITGEGKILSITIGSTDGISVSETTPASAEEPNYQFSSPHSIGGNLDYNHAFTTPADGLIRLTSTAETTGGTSVQTRDTNGGNVIILRLPVGSNGDVRTVTVKKGTKIWLNKTEADSVVAHFHSFVTV